MPEEEAKESKEEVSAAAASADSGSSSASTSGPRFEVKWNAVAMWAWDIQVDTCAICRNHIMDPCIECQANTAATDAEDCVVAWECATTLFIFTAFLAGLRPGKYALDNKDWEFQKYGR